MTAEQFRRLALSLPETSESAHMGHPDFQVGGKIFATMGSTNLELWAARIGPVREALTIAWRARAPKRIARILKDD